MFKYFSLKSMIEKLNNEASNMYQYRLSTSVVRLCGFTPEVEEKLYKRFPKTYKEYIEAKERWFREYDKTSKNVDLYFCKANLAKIVSRVKSLNAQKSDIEGIIEECYEDIKHYDRVIKKLEEEI